MGDVNADIDCILVLRELIDARHFVDVGAHADVFGQPLNQPTCVDRKSKTPSRRGFAFSSPDLFPAFRQFQVVRADSSPAHANILFQPNWKQLPHTTLIVTKPASLGQRLSQFIDTALGPPPIANCNFDNSCFPDEQPTRIDAKTAKDFQKAVLGELRDTRDQLRQSTIDR